MNDNDPPGGVGPIVSAPPAPTAAQRRLPLPALLGQAGLALAVLVLAWTADAMR